MKEQAPFGRINPPWKENRGERTSSRVIHRIGRLQMANAAKDYTRRNKKYAAQTHEEIRIVIAATI